MTEDNTEDKEPQEKQDEQHGKEMKGRWSETPADSSSPDQTGASSNQETASQPSQEYRDYIRSIQNQSYDNPTPLDTPKGPEISSENKDPQENQNEQPEQRNKEMKTYWSEGLTGSSSPDQTGTSSNQETANRFSQEEARKLDEAACSPQGSNPSNADLGYLRPLDTPKVSPPEGSPPEGNYRAIWRDKPRPR
jgi:hypothetical protein